MRAWAIKSGRFLDVQTIRPTRTHAIDDYLAWLGSKTTWSDLESRGYRVVEVEIKLYKRKQIKDLGLKDARMGH